MVLFRAPDPGLCGTHARVLGLFLRFLLHLLSVSVKGGECLDDVLLTQLHLELRSLAGLRFLGSLCVR